MASEEFRPRYADARLLLCTMGYACFFTAAERSLRDAISIFGNLGFSEFTSIAYPTIFLFSTLLIISTVAFIKKKQHFSPLFGLLGSLLLVFGYMGTLYLYHLDVSFWLLLCSGAAFGIGSALGFLAWVEELSQKRDKAVLTMLAASVLSSAMSLTMNPCKNITDILLICSMFATLSGICFVILFLLEKNAKSSGGNLRENDLKHDIHDAYNPDLKSLMHFIWQPALCVGALAFLASIARSIVGKDQIDTTIVVTFIGAIIACFFLFVLFSAPLSHSDKNFLARFLPLRDDIVSVYKFLFPVNAFLFLLLAFFGDGYALFLAGFAEISITVCHILMWVQSIEFGRKLGIAPFIVLGFFSGIVYFILFWGYPIVFLGSGYFGYAFRAVIAIIAVYVLAMVLFTSLKVGIHIRKKNQGSLGSEDNENDQRKSLHTNVTADDSASPESDYLKAIADDYYLSNREQQVLEMLIKGRDVPYIATAMILSKNTIRSHIKSIYFKLDVHSRQELLDTCEKIQQL